VTDAGCPAPRPKRRAASRSNTTTRCDDALPDWSAALNHEWLCIPNAAARGRCPAPYASPTSAQHPQGRAARPPDPSLPESSESLSRTSLAACPSVAVCPIIARTPHCCPPLHPSRTQLRSSNTPPSTPRRRAPTYRIPTVHFCGLALCRSPLPRLLWVLKLLLCCCLSFQTHG
jgi:hypothetical protein